MTDIAADLRLAVEVLSNLGYDTDPHTARLLALADAVEAKDPTAWGMEPHATERWLVGAGWSKPGRLEERVVAWRFPTATETEDVAG